MTGFSDLDEFSEKLQTAFDPPPPAPLVLENNVALFWEVLKSATKFLGLEWPPFSENSLLFSLKITAKICNIFLDRKFSENAYKFGTPIIPKWYNDSMQA